MLVGCLSCDHRPFQTTVEVVSLQQAAQEKGFSSLIVLGPSKTKK
jgi:hypothetical protein